MTGALSRPAKPAGVSPGAGAGSGSHPGRSPHASGTVPSPTRADFHGRLQAIGLGRWASLYPGARRAGGASSREGRRPR